MTLNELMPGEKARVIKVEGSGAVRRRILDLGITKGSTLCVRKLAPLKDPMEITIRGYELSLRKSECETIVVERLA